MIQVWKDFKLEIYIALSNVFLVVLGIYNSKHFKGKHF